MFYQTYVNPTQDAVSAHSRNPVAPGGYWIDPSAVRILQRTGTAQALQCIVNCDDSAVFRFLFLVTLAFDFWPWHSNSSERGTKHVFRVNLAQIRSAVPEIFEAQRHKKITDGAKKEPHLRVVTISFIEKYTYMQKLRVENEDNIKIEQRIYVGLLFEGQWIKKLALTIKEICSSLPPFRKKAVSPCSNPFWSEGFFLFIVATFSTCCSVYGVILVLAT